LLGSSLRLSVPRILLAERHQFWGVQRLPPPGLFEQFGHQRRPAGLVARPPHTGPGIAVAVLNESARSPAVRIGPEHLIHPVVDAYQGRKALCPQPPMSRIVCKIPTRPFEWKFTRNDLARLMKKLADQAARRTAA
jgi:hypothetical protein